VHELDSLLREHVAPALRTGARGDSGVARALRAGFEEAALHAPAQAKLRSLTLAVSPFTSFTIGRDDTMVQLTRSFEFSAAHRLCCPGLSDEENRRLFGKCSNPHGHGHNYVVDVTVRGDIDETSGTIVDLPALDRIVKERVIQPLDHKHLNVECEEFAGLNPSVENIARVIFRRLDGAFDRAELCNVRVWETPKTYADVNRQDR
jgi:6-pyruvoyltetrahydropterin/6-carboxytetrahydropterin synthase